MKDFHEVSEILSAEKIRQFSDALFEAWTRETCFPILRDEWSENNRALGQCAVTSLVVQDFFGGEFADNKKFNHVWNILPDGSHHDFCRSQFREPADLGQFTIKTREDLLGHKKSEEVEMMKRYLLLKESVLGLIEV